MTETVSMVVDTSAVVALLTQEPGYDEIEAQLSQADIKVMSAATVVELGIVLESRLGSEAATTVNRFLRDAEVTVEPLEVDHAERALEGWRRYGKGRGHPAQLNLGDSYTYGLAATMGYPILCTGDDFAATDMEVLRPQPN